MSRLVDIQEAFQRFLLTGDAGIATHIVGTERVPAEARLGIYANAYRSRLVEYLQMAFPALARLLDADFRSMAEGYIAAHESTFFSIRYYGDRLSKFLARDEQYARRPVLAELARWEWAVSAAFDAPDCETLGAAELAAVVPAMWADLRFRFSPSVQVLDLQWNAPRIWQALTAEDNARKDEKPPLAPKAVAVSPALNAMDPQPAPQGWLLWRQGLQLFFRPLPAPERAALRSAQAGEPFGALCVLLCDHFDESQAALQAAVLLRGWVESGLIIRS